MNKTVAILLFAGMVAGCVSSISQPELNPAPAQPTPDPVPNNEIWVHWFQLGGTLETHRKSCITLSGTWNYINEECESPVIPNFGSPSVVIFNRFPVNDPDLLKKNIKCTSSVSFVYIDDRAFLNTWLEYCYGDFGEPFIKDDRGWGWVFNNAVLVVGNGEEVFSVNYLLCNFPVPQRSLYSTTGSH